MKKNIIVVVAVVVLLSLASYLFFLPGLSEKKFNKILCYYIARNLTDGVTDFKAKVNIIKTYVHENIHPVAGYRNRLDTVAAEKLISGIGWCDQQSRVFMQLSWAAGITSRLLFLRNDAGSSPHTVAEVLAPDGRWVIVDTAYNLDLRNSRGEFASQSDIKNDINIIKNNERVRRRSKFSDRWSDKGYLGIYYNEPIYVVTKKANRFDYLKFIPAGWLRPVVAFMQDRYLEQLPDRSKDIYGVKMSRARGYHLLGYYDKADSIYKDIINHSSDARLVYEAEFYYGLSLKDQKKYEDAESYLTSIIENQRESLFLPYIYGLRASVRNKLGKLKEAESDLTNCEYSMEVY